MRNGNLRRESERVGRSRTVRNQSLPLEPRNGLDNGRDRWRTHPKARLHWANVDASPGSKELAASHEPRQRLIDGGAASKVKEPFGGKGGALRKFLGSLKNGFGQGRHG